MMISTNNIFTVQTNKDCKEPIVHIETIITKGLYRFTLLGMHTKYASDAKDRVYSALRSSDLLNLKSDNRKIIVNLSPDETSKREGIYDLGIALSLLSCIDKRLPEQRMLAIGGLSITGKITASKRLRQAIYTAYSENINYIVCSKQDMKLLDKEDIEQLKACGIHIIAEDSLNKLVHALKNLPPILEEITLKTLPDLQNKLTSKGKFEFTKLDEFNRALLVAIGGGHNILIQSSSSKHIKESCEEMENLHLNNKMGQVTFAAFNHKTLDNEVHGENIYIENIKNIPKTTLISNQTVSQNCIIGLYTPCSCGYQFSFFDSSSPERKCICSKRTVLQHKRYIESTYFDCFTMHITNTILHIERSSNLIKMIIQLRRYIFNRYINAKKLTVKEVYLFPDNSFTNNYIETKTLETLLTQDAREIYDEHMHINSILQLTQTIQDCLDIEEGSKNKKPVLSKQALVLAISYIPRMDF